MIGDALVFEYEQAVGPVAFTLARVKPERMPHVEQLMRDAIDGKRGPVTDRDLGLDIPEDVES